MADQHIEGLRKAARRTFWEAKQLERQAQARDDNFYEVLSKYLDALGRVVLDEQKSIYIRERAIRYREVIEFLMGCDASLVENKSFIFDDVIQEHLDNDDAVDEYIRMCRLNERMKNG